MDDNVVNRLLDRGKDDHLFYEAADEIMRLRALVSELNRSMSRQLIDSEVRAHLPQQDVGTASNAR